jgi:hypothetical protein
MEEVGEHFGFGERRQMLCGRLLDLLRRARDCGFTRAVLFGSFVSSKEQPGDIDLFWTLPDGADTNDLGVPCRELVDTQHSKQRFGFDLFWCYDVPDAIEFMAGLWAVDRIGRKRGLVMVQLR